MLLDFLKDGSSGKTIETKNSDGVTLKWNNLKIQKYNDDMKSDVMFSPGIGVEYRVSQILCLKSRDDELFKFQISFKKAVQLVL